MKIKLSKFLTIALFSLLIGFVSQTSYASEILGTLSTGTDSSQTTNTTQTTITNNQTDNPQTLNAQVTSPQNNLASLINSNTVNSAISNLLGTGNNSAVMLEGIVVGSLLTFFVGLLIYMIILFIRKGHKKTTIDI
jgi:ABC-type dipeptide/oligopeptide/nickel transport system permease subunit